MKDKQMAAFWTICCVKCGPGPLKTSRVPVGAYGECHELVCGRCEMVVALLPVWEVVRAEPEQMGAEGGDSDWG